MNGENRSTPESVLYERAPGPPCRADPERGRAGGGSGYGAGLEGGFCASPVIGTKRTGATFLRSMPVGVRV